MSPSKSEIYKIALEDISKLQTTIDALREENERLKKENEELRK